MLSKTEATFGKKKVMRLNCYVTSIDLNTGQFFTVEKEIWCISEVALQRRIPLAKHISEKDVTKKKEKKNTLIHTIWQRRQYQGST